MPAPTNDTRRALWTMVGVAVVIAAPLGVAGALKWIDFSASHDFGRSAPHWLTAGPVRATTRDGTLVKLSVAFDAGSSSTQSAVADRIRDVGLLLEVCIGARSVRELRGPSGIERLGRDILERVNAFLAVNDIDPLRRVAIQDIWYTSP